MYKIRQPSQVFDTHLPYHGITPSTQEALRRYVRTRRGGDADEADASGDEHMGGTTSDEEEPPLLRGELRLLTDEEKATRGLAALVANGVAVAGTGVDSAMGAFELFQVASKSQHAQTIRRVDKDMRKEQQRRAEHQHEAGDGGIGSDDALPAMAELQEARMTSAIQQLRTLQARQMLPTVSNGPGTNDVLVAHSNFLSTLQAEKGTATHNSLCRPRTRYYANLSRFADNIVRQCMLLDVAHNLVGSPIILMLLNFGAYTITDDADIHLNIVLWGKFAQGKSYMLSRLTKGLVPGTYETVASLSSMADRSNKDHVRRCKHMKVRVADELPYAMFGVAGSMQQSAGGTQAVNTDSVAVTKAWLTTQTVSHERCEKDESGEFFTNFFCERADTLWVAATNAAPNGWDDAIANRFLMKLFSVPDDGKRTVLDVECSEANDQGQMKLLRDMVEEGFQIQHSLVTQLNLLTRLSVFPNVAMTVANNFIRLVMNRAKAYGVTNADDPRCLERLKMLVRIMAKVDAVDNVYNAPTKEQLNASWDLKDQQDEEKLALHKAECDRLDAEIAEITQHGALGLDDEGDDARLAQLRERRHREFELLDANRRGRDHAAEHSSNKWHDKAWDPVSLLDCFPRMTGTIEMCVLAMTMLDEFAHSRRNAVLRTLDHMFFGTHKLDVSARALHWQRGLKRSWDEYIPTHSQARRPPMPRANAGMLECMKSIDQAISDDEYSGDEDDMNEDTLHSGVAANLASPADRPSWPVPDVETPAANGSTGSTAAGGWAHPVLTTPGDYIISDREVARQKHPDNPPFASTRREQVGLAASANRQPRTITG